MNLKYHHPVIWLWEYLLFATLPWDKQLRVCVCETGQKCSFFINMKNKLLCSFLCNECILFWLCNLSSVICATVCTHRFDLSHLHWFISVSAEVCCNIYIYMYVIYLMTVSPVTLKPFLLFSYLRLIWQADKNRQIRFTQNWCKATKSKWFRWVNSVAKRYSFVYSALKC